MARERRNAGGWLCAGGSALLLLCSLALPDGAAAQTAPPPAPADKWGAHLDLEGKLGNNRDLGEADVFLPLWQDGTSLVFGNLKARLDDNASREGNFGLGLRHMLESGWNLGTYGFFDRRRTETHNWFSQATFGVEALSLDWDLRANAYVPMGTRTHDLGGAAGGASTAAMSGTTVTITTPGASTREERSLQGFDAEIGWRVPIFAGDDGMQLRLYGGAYRFYANEVNPVQGPRGRVEMVFDEVPFLWSGSRLALGGEVQHDGPRGTTGFASARLRIPLQVFGAGTSAARLTPIERRMTDPVVRDIDIVAQSRTVTSPATVETATTASGGSALTVLNSSTTTGAALPGAVSAAGANTTVLLSGTFSTSATITLQAGQILRGGGSLVVQSASGRTATLTMALATINAATAGGNANPAIALANNSTVTNLTVNHASSAGVGTIGIRGVNVTGVTVSNNTISSSESGAANTLAVEFTGTSAGTISGNTITASGSAGNSAHGLTLSNSGSTIVSNNSLGASGATNNRYLSLSSANIASGSSGNTQTGGVCNVAAGGSGTFVAFSNAGNCGP